MLAPFVNVTELLAATLMSPPTAVCVAVLLMVPALLLKVFPALMLIEPPGPSPVVDAVMRPLLFTWTWFALTVISPPVADDTLPDVAADKAPPFWTVTVSALSVISPPAAVLCVSVEMLLPVPSIKMDWAGLASPWTVI